MSDVHTSDALRPAVTWEPDEGLIIKTRSTTVLPARLAPRDALKITKGASWGLKVTWRLDDDPRDLSSGWTAAFTIASAPDAAAQLTLMGGSGITLGASNQNILLAVTAVQTAALSFVRGYAVLTLTETGVAVTRLFEGPCDLGTG
jgi:hypothetical protein